VGAEIVTSVPAELRGTPPARTSHELASLLRATGMPEASRRTYALLWLMFATAGRIIGTHTISPHSFRHSAIAIALGDGRPLHVVQAFAGHADSRTTRRYDRARDSLDRSPAYEPAASVAPEVSRSVLRSDSSIGHP
jgi:integrase